MIYNIKFISLESKNISLAVVDENNQSIQSGFNVTWYDSQGNELGTGSSIGGVKKDTELYYSVSLGESLGKQYREVTKQKASLENETIVCQLHKIEEVTLHGKVSAYGTPLYRAEVNLTQWLNGKYEYTANTLTDANGEFTLNAYNDSTELIVLANGYIDNKIVRRHLNNGGELETIEMNEVQGKVVALNLSYQEATKEGVEPIIQNWYSDTRNIDYKVQNLTKGTEITDYAIQQGNIVLPTGTDRGDRIQITVSSLNDKFTNVTAEGIIAGNDTANVDITLLAFGGIEAVYSQKADDNLLAMLYDNTGKLQMRTVCSSSRLTFTNLAAGTYSLVTMGYNGAIGSVADLSDLASMDLYEGADYVLSSATVRDGYIASVNVASVPELDASKFEYTGTNTSYMPNKTQLVAGNFITLTARLDFKEQYAGKADNAKVVVEIPEGCEFVPNSVVIGAKPIPHSLNGNRLTITVDKENLDRRIRFCVIPTETGTYMTTAYAEFDYKGTKTQPMGQIKFESTSGDYYVPSTTRTPTIMVGGIGVPKADVEVYDGESLIGTTRSLANGKWSLNCELNNAYNLSTHSIYVKYRGEGNVVGKTDAKDCFYDINAVIVQSVTMLNTAHPAGNLTPTQYSSVWDFHALTSSKDYYLYWPEYPDFTFLVNLSENDTTKVSDVVLSVYTMDGDVRRLPATYDGKHGCFVATSSFDSYSTPVNVSVEMKVRLTPMADRNQMDEKIAAIDNKKQDLQELADSISEFNEDIEYIVGRSEQEQTELTSLQNQINIATQNDASTVKLISEYLTILGHTCTETDLDVDVPEYSTTEFDNLIIDINNLLNSDIGVTSLISEAQSFASDMERIFDSSFALDEDEILTNNIGDTIYFEKDGIEMMYYEIDYSSIDLTNLDENNMVSLSMTDGSLISAFVGNNYYLIVDHQNKKGWIIEEKYLSNIGAKGHNIVRRAPMDDIIGAITNLQNIVSAITNWVAENTRPIREEIRTIEEGIRNQRNWLTVAETRGNQIANDIRKIEEQLKYLDNWAQGGLSKTDARRYAQLIEEQTALQAKRAKCLNEAKTLRNEIRQTESRLAQLNKTKFLRSAVLAQIMDVYEIRQGLLRLIDFGNQAAQDGRKWDSFIQSIPSTFNCSNASESKDLSSRAENLRWNASADKDRFLHRYWGAMGVSGVSTSITTFLMFNKSAGAVLKFISPFVTGMLNNFSTSFFNDTRANSQNAYNNRLKEKNSLKCKNNKKKDDNDDNDKDKRKNKDPKTKEDDPSGFVYEAVPTNRIEGVKATIYYAEDGEIDYPIQWDAAEFGQINPQITEEDGLYAWDVPQGLWKVIFEKEGYETTQTDWLPVPPPQLEINIPMSQAVAPYVENALGAESGITLDFSKYMKPNTLTKSSRVTVTCNGEKASGDVELLNLEENPFNNEEYASKIKFVPNKSFKTSDEVIITVKKEVESYAGKQMVEDFVQRVKIKSEITEIACDSVIAVDYQGTGVLELSVLPAAAAKGRTIQVASTSSMIASTDAQSVTLNDEGKARIVVSGELPGSTSLHLSMPDADKEKYVAVSVVTKEEQVVKTPKASKLSGSSFEDSYLLSLTCTTKGATIYYTIDGSCPCDEQTRKKYTGPITLPEGQITLKAIAVREGMVDSQVATYEYTINKGLVTGISSDERLRFDVSFHEGQININGAKGDRCHIFDLLGHELASRNISGNQISIKVPRSDVYIVSIQHNDETFVYKVLAK